MVREVGTSKYLVFLCCIDNRRAFFMQSDKIFSLYKTIIRISLQIQKCQRRIWARLFIQAHHKAFLGQLRKSIILYKHYQALPYVKNKRKKKVEVRGIQSLECSQEASKGNLLIHQYSTVSSRILSPSLF